MCLERYWRFFILILSYAYVYVYRYKFVCIWRCQEKGVGAPRAPRQCELPHMGAGNWTLSSKRAIYTNTLWAFSLFFSVLKVSIEKIEMNLTLQAQLALRPLQLEGMISESLEFWHSILYLEIADVEFLESKYSPRNERMRPADPKESILRIWEKQMLEPLLHKSELGEGPKNLLLYAVCKGRGCWPGTTHWIDRKGIILRTQ